MVNLKVRILSVREFLIRKFIEKITLKIDKKIYMKNLIKNRQKNLYGIISNNFTNKKTISDKILAQL
jgi:hypothetical protein